MPGQHTVTFRCADCDRWCRRYRRRGQPLICVDCGIRRAGEHMREMARRAGEGYDRWQQSPGPRGRPPKPKG